MKFVVVGGGPAGLHFAYLIKRARPEHAVTVLEQNARGATYGFGIVFTDLEFVREFDEPFAREVESRQHGFVDGMCIVHRGVETRVAGFPFKRMARSDLLDVLAARCEDVGVSLQYDTRVTDERMLGDPDVIVIADGVHSTLRDRHREAFGTSLGQRAYWWAWYGTRAPFPDVTIAFQPHADGLYIGHAYQYAPGRSAFVVEAPPSTWTAAGFQHMDEERTRAHCSTVFQPVLRGESLLSNRSSWFRYPVVVNRRWSYRNMVLAGDCMRTGHPTIGAGTRLAMHDAQALMRAFESHPHDVPAAFAAYEFARRPGSDAMVEVAQRSVDWYETVHDRLALDPVEFTYSYMTRTGRIDREGLRRRDAAFVERYEAHEAARTSSTH